MNTRKYETLFIVDAKLTDSEVLAIAEKFKKTITDQGGNVETAEKWDKRKLAYEIDGHREGNYVILQFEAGATVPHELNRQMRISDDVIRFRTFLR